MVHANRMKTFVDPALRPIEPPIDDNPSEPYLDQSDMPAGSFKVSESSSHGNGKSGWRCEHLSCLPPLLQMLHVD